MVNQNSDRERITSARDGRVGVITLDDAESRNAFANFRLISVDLCGVDMAEAGLQGCRDDAQHVLPGHAVGPKPERGDGRAAHRDELH